MMFLSKKRCSTHRGISATFSCIFLLSKYEEESREKQSPLTLCKEYRSPRLTTWTLTDGGHVGDAREVDERRGEPHRRGRESDTRTL